jgi:uncharacterized protein (DUF362 family)
LLNKVLDDQRVGIYRDDLLMNYCDSPPFHPSIAYPEYPFSKIDVCQTKNRVYDGVRNLLITLQLDKNHIGSKKWNPLGEIIQPGDKVVIKPNFVLDKHAKGGDLYSIITHPSIIRAIVDYVYIALKGEGDITIADAPQADCNFDNLLKTTQVHSIQEFYKKNKINVGLFDLRQMRFVYNKEGFLDSNSRIYQDGDPKGYVIVDLKEKSEFSEWDDFSKIYGADYDREEVMNHHNKDKNEYCVSKTILNADVVISVPKMKVHRKTGVTLNLKNLVGINGNKNYLPHYRIGTPADGGDEFCDLSKNEKTVLYTKRWMIDRLLAKPNKLNDFIYSNIKGIYKKMRKALKLEVRKDIIAAGDWCGNDTTWRMVLDLNKIMLYSDGNGNLCSVPRRKFFSIIDGIVGGEGEGPLLPDTKKCGVLIAGFNPLAVDIVTSKIMGLNVDKIIKFNRALKQKRYRFINEVENIQVYEDGKVYSLQDYLKWAKIYDFRPAAGWREISD